MEFAEPRTERVSDSYDRRVSSIETVLNTPGMPDNLLGVAAVGGCLGYAARCVVVLEVEAPGAPARWGAARSMIPTGLVEGVSAVLLVSVTVVHSALPTVALWVLSIVGIVLAWVDGATHRIPDSVNGLGLIAMLIVLAMPAIAGPDAEQVYARALLAGAALACFYLTVALMSGGLGLGDVKASGTVGVALGWVGWLEVLRGTLVALVLAACWGVFLMIREREVGQVPYGVFLYGGALAVLAG